MTIYSHHIPSQSWRRNSPSTRLVIGPQATEFEYGHKTRGRPSDRGDSRRGYTGCCKPCTSPPRKFPVISRRRFLKTAGMALVGSSASFRGGAAVNPVRYVDVASSAGISFQHDNAASPDNDRLEKMDSVGGW